MVVNNKDDVYVHVYMYKHTLYIMHGLHYNVLCNSQYNGMKY